ncbi:MAG: YccF domain-containing protein [Muribaculaceae bacterium]|nr:YccF domain-containing protein [Muribaculaceae bacterium]
MKFLGNIIWLVFGGIFIAAEYVFAGLLLCITIIGIPFGVQAIKLSLLALWPFGKHVRQKQAASGCLSTCMNLIWLVFGGIFIALEHVFLGIIFYITIIGIPFGKQHFKLASIALTPFGHEVVSAQP